MFTDHLLKVLHRFQRDRVFGFAKIDVGAGINAALRKDNFHRIVRRNLRGGSGRLFLAA